MLMKNIETNEKKIVYTTNANFKYNFSYYGINNLVVEYMFCCIGD